MGWVRRRRYAAALCAVAFIASACTSSSTITGPPQPTKDGRAASPRSPAPRLSTLGPSSGTTGGATGGSSTGTTSVLPAYDDEGPLGAMARAFARSSPARSLVVEVDWVSGREPLQSALDHLASVLRRELDKPSGIVVQRGHAISASRSTWTIDDLIALERSTRAEHSSGTRATMWICYVNGSLQGSSNALGVSFQASSAVIFRDRLNDAATSSLFEPGIERSVILHEAGHLMGLVNIGYRSRFDHEDAAHPHHSNNPDSVMYWAVEDISVRTVLRGGPPDDFDDADRADLAMLRSPSS